MQQTLLVSILGNYDSLFAQALIDTALKSKCLILESHLHKIDALISGTIRISGNWSGIAKFENQLPRLEEKWQVKFLSERLAEPEKLPEKRLSYIVHAISEHSHHSAEKVLGFFSTKKIQIIETHITSYQSPNTQTLIYRLS
jgi:glycine cleavage system transcriptional repressor